MAKRGLGGRTANLEGKARASARRDSSDASFQTNVGGTTTSGRWWKMLANAATSSSTAAVMSPSAIAFEGNWEASVQRLWSGEESSSVFGIPAPVNQERTRELDLADVMTAGGQ